MRPPSFNAVQSTPLARSLTPRQLELLEQFRVEGQCAPVPFARIHDWHVVLQMFALFGATWAKGKFVFPADVDAQAAIDEALRTGIVADPQLRSAEFYATPPELADRIVELANPSADHVILEPSAGDGALVMALQKQLGRGAWIDAIELLPDNHRALRKGLGATIIGSDFFATAPRGPYNRVVMNPPVAKHADIRHVTRAFSWLAPGGLLVSVMSVEALSSEDKAAQDFRMFGQKHGLSLGASRLWYEELDPEIFEDTGISFRPILVRLQKRPL